MIYDFRKIKELEDIAELREIYLQELMEPQEMFLELQVRSGTGFVINLGKEEVGYFILSEDFRLIEFYVKDRYKAEEILKIIINKFSIKKAFCSSFNSFFLKAIRKNSRAEKLEGYNFRHLKSQVFQEADDISFRLATIEDFNLIKELNEEVFEKKSEIEEYLENQYILLFIKAGITIGFGIFAPVIKGRNDYDIGMCVNKNYRKKNYGTYIIKFLINYCKNRGWRPIAGCDVNNIGSAKTLHKAGFRDPYKMYEIKF